MSMEELPDGAQKQFDVLQVSFIAWQPNDIALRGCQRAICVVDPLLTLDTLQLKACHLKGPRRTQLSQAAQKQRSRQVARGQATTKAIRAETGPCHGSS